MPAKPIAHGTMRGYHQHIYRKNNGQPEGETCEDCRRAWREYCDRKAVERLLSK